VVAPGALAGSSAQDDPDGSSRATRVHGQRAASEPVSTAAEQYEFHRMFASTVTLRQLTQWLPNNELSVLDLSLPLDDAGPGDDRIGDLLRSNGHQVTTVRAPQTWHDGDEANPPGRTLAFGDIAELNWLPQESFDAVIAEGGVLSHHLATEDTLTGIARLLRPGGRVLASVHSMVSGLAALAEQNRWPELADAPRADVVLVPDPERADTYLRCFAPEDARECFESVGLEIEWIRPRTLLPAATVQQAMSTDPATLGELVISELTLEMEHEDEAHGARLVISARKPR
jgi:SAM-dependent methyltransferase